MQSLKCYIPSYMLALCEEQTKIWIVIHWKHYLKYNVLKLICTCSTESLKKLSRTILNKHKWDFTATEDMSCSRRVQVWVWSMYFWSCLSLYTFLFFFTLLFIKGTKSQIKNRYFSHDRAHPHNGISQLPWTETSVITILSESYIFCRSVWQKLLRVIEILGHTGDICLAFF